MPRCGLGRLEKPDPRDRAYEIKPLLRAVARELPPQPAPRTWRYRFSNGWWGDQGSTPQCVAYAWAHFIEDGPISYRNVRKPFVPAHHIYREAQQIDEWPGTNYDGTSVRAGAKVLRQMGFITEFRWAWDVETVLRTVELIGPVVMGTWWYSSMWDTDSEGKLKVSGDQEGGHAYILNGYNRRTGMVRCKNSWGRGWGKNGFFYLSVQDLARLIDEEGEACIALEQRKTFQSENL